MISFLKVFSVTVIATLLLDFSWIALIMNKFYHNQIGFLLRLKADGGLDPIFWPAAAVYICIPLGVILFVLPKVATTDGLLAVLPWGFLYGILLYGVYDFTNYSLLKDWPLAVTLVDWMWGGILCGITSVVALWMSRLA
jgi:uncharacterized membrane protein